MKINGNLQFLGLGQIENLRVENLASDPTTPALGQIWYNTTTGVYMGFDGLVTFPFATGGNATAIQSELDRVEAAVGLNSDGTFAAFVGTNYLGSATTQAGAVALLDAAIKTIADAIAAETTARTAADAAEVTARNAAVAAEAALRTTAVTDEATARAAADAAEVIARDAAIAAEATLRAAADAAEVTARNTAIATAATAASDAVAAEATTRAGADAQEVIDRNAAVAAEAALRATADTAETAARIAADATDASTAANQLATETTARLAGDAAVNTRVDGVQTEVNAIESGVGLNTDGTYTAPSNTNYVASATSLKDAVVALDAAVFAAAGTAAGDYSSLQAAIAAEESARIAGDTALSNALQAYIDGKVAANDTIDAAEAASRIAADLALQNEINAVEAAVGLAADGTFVAPTGTNYVDGATTVLNAVTLIDAQVFTNTGALAAETAARTAADASFTSALNVETAARVASDLAQQSEIDTVEAGAGLETDGTYASPTGSNYLNAATSLKDADFKLDAAVKVAADAAAAVAAANTTNATAIAAEATARAAGDTTNANAIAAEATARAAGDATNATAISDEATARAAGDATNATAIAAEVTRATAAEAAVSTAVTAEVTRATAAEAAIVSTATTNAATAATATAAEVTRATAAEAALATSIAGVAAKTAGGYFLYTAASASTSHTVTHSMGNQFANVTVVDSTNQVVIPQSITFDDVNQLTVTFNTAITCKVVVSGLKA